MMDILKRLALVFLFLIVLVVGLFYYVIATDSGLQRAFSIAENYLGEDLAIGGVQGKLIGPGGLQDLSFKNAAGIDLQVRSADFDWSPKRLFSKELHVALLEVDGLTLRLPESEPAEAQETKEPFALSDLQIPFAMQADRVAITDVTVYPPGAEEPVIIDEVLLRAGGAGDALEILELSVKSPQGNLRLDGSATTSGDWPVAADAEWNIITEQFGEISGQGTVSGNTKTLNVKHEVSGFVNAQLAIDVKDPLGELAWDGNVKANSDDIGILGEALVGIPFTLDVDTDGSLEQFNANGNLTTEHSETGPLSTDFNLTGTLDQIELSDSTVSFEQSSTELAYEGTVDLKALEADVELDWRELEYPLVVDPKLVLSPSGSLRFTGNAENYSVELDTVVQQEIAGELNITLNASGTPEEVTIAALTVDGPPTSVNGAGVVNLKTREVDINGDWTDVRWPLIGDEVLVSSSSAQFSVSGTLDDYQVDAELALAGKDIPEGDWKISTRGNTEKLTGLELSGNILEGTVSASGDVVFSPQPQWDLALQANGINPGVQWPEHPGDVSFAATSKGSMTDTGPDLIADIQSLSGDYKGMALGGGGRVKLADGEFSADGLSAKVGSATVDLDGAFGDELDLAWQMNADQLSGLVPGVSGDIALDGKVTGTKEAPKLEFNLDANDFKSGGLTTASLTGAGVIDLTGATESNIDIVGESLVVAGYQWQDVSIKGGGIPEQHQLSVNMTGDAPDLSLDLTGGVEGDQWNGSLDTLELLQTTIGDWKLHEPVAIDATKSAVSTGILCLTNLPAVLCVDTNWQAEAGVKARLGIQSFNSELYSDLLPPDIAIDAPLSGKLDFSMQPGGKPAAIGEFYLPEGRIQFTSQGDVITAILGDSTARVNLQDDQLNTEVDLALGQIGTLNAKAVITDLYDRQNLSGNIRSEIADISLAGIGATQVSNIDGAFASDIQLGGTLTAPQVVGGLNLTGFGAEVPSQSLKFEDGNIQAASDGNGRLVISGQIKSGEGELVINGAINPETADVDLTIKGDNFQVANAKRQKAVISPDIEIVINSESISVLGDLLIPSAFVAAGGDSGVITESADVKIKQEIDAEAEAEAAESRVRLGINVQLGDDVKVKAGQFDGALAGGLSLEQVPGKVPTGSGVVEVVGGDYLIYGQNLTIERGRILFGGGPLDNPALEFDVFREVTEYDVKAGVQVRGTAQQPLLELQSEPEQTDANTLSFILFGKPVGEGISYTLGRFITPDLYVSYGIDILTQVQAFNMRYRISDRLALIATSSTESGADFLYTIER